MKSLEGGDGMSATFDTDTNEIHGVYGTEIDEQFAHLLGRAIGTRMAAGRIVIGGDVRSSTPSLKKALINGVLRTGCEVYDVGIVPTPVLYFAKDRLWADGAIMVTGSHHPAPENGFSITLGKLPTTDIEISELREIIDNAGPFASGAGELYAHDILQPYESFLVAQFVPADPLLVVVDANNGTMGQIARTTLGYVGYELLECNCSPAGDFGGRIPDPFLPENVALLSRQVLARGAHLGVAYDGDGDQVVFAAEQGTIMTPDQALVLFARALLIYQPGSLIVYDESFAPFVAEEILKVGGNPRPQRTTSTGIKRTLLEQGAVLGADTKGHYFFRTMGGDDALYATLVMLRIVSRFDGALEAIIADLV
jgi:phosphomannomutase/phosphoglucomutase